MQTELDNLPDIKLFQITSPHFVCGLEVSGEDVIRTAPIIKYMKGWKIFQVEAYCLKRKWSLIRVLEDPNKKE